MKLVGMSDSLAGFKVAACPSRSQLNGVLMRPRRFASLVTRAATSHKVDKAVSAAPGRHAIRKFENGLKDANLTAGQKPIASSNQGGLRPHQINAGSNQKLRVAVDVDEVLGRFVHSLNNFCLEEYGLEYAVRDYHVYDFAKVWRCSQDEANHKVHEFFKSDHFSSGIEVIPGAFEALRRLRGECDLMVVTSRQHVIQEPTLEWLEAHFPEVFQAVHFGNHFALEGTSRKKSEICHAIGAHVLIDDNPSYAMECATAGINVLLYDWEHQYPWSKTDEGPKHERITRVRDWAEVEQVLGVLAAGYSS